MGEKDGENISKSNNTIQQKRRMTGEHDKKMMKGNSEGKIEIQ